LDARIEEWTRCFPVEEVVERLQKAGVPAGAVQDAADIVADPHLAARDYFVPLQHPLIGGMVVDASPIKFRGEPRPSWRPSPLLGEHNRCVFQGLMGLTDEEYSYYVQREVIA
jgi:crotonobetainyl-CoA:carnitine CoA-transferase CaiB-like acyl-CoA transferase